MGNNYINIIEFTIKELKKSSLGHFLKEYVVLYDSRDLSTYDIKRIIDDVVSASNSTHHFEFPVRSDCVFMTKKAFKCVFRSMLNKEGKTDGSL